jgi:GR25 family glycosyltransferase involved in LPS biosynthesis
MEDQFKKYDIEAERFSAISLTKEQNDDLVKRGCNFYDDPRPEYAPRIKSCTISHLTVLLRSKMMNYRNVLIFEDDASFDDNIVLDLSDCVNDLSNIDWDMFYLGCNPLEYYKETDSLGRVLRTTTNHAYAINRSYPCNDGYYGNLGLRKENKIYMALKNLVTQRKNYSDIESSEVDYTLSIADKYRYNVIQKPAEW